ncbi:MAG TPA: hypothetical protein VGJ20_41470 [Xanthobacteraceae bacterium]
MPATAYGPAWGPHTGKGDGDDEGEVRGAVSQTQDESAANLDPIGYVFKIADQQRDFDLVKNF